MDLNKIIESNDVDKYTFGRFVRNRREELGKTVRSFAKELDITAAYLSDIEKGNRYAPKAKLEMMFNLLRIPADQKLAFMDLASLTRGEFEDLNPYLGRSSAARLALRTAEEINLSDEKWLAFIKTMK